MTGVCKVTVYKPRITNVVSALRPLPLEVEQITYILVRFLKKLEEANCELGLGVRIVGLVTSTAGLFADGHGQLYSLIE